MRIVDTQQTTHIDRQVGSSVFGINLVSRPPAHVQSSILELQSAIEAALPSGIAFRAPAESLHLSIFQFVSARDTNPRRSSDWRARQHKVISALDAIASNPWDISLAAPRLELRPAAIIMVYPSSSDLEALRNRIEESPSLTGLSSHRPGLQHVSLFRYSTEMPLEQLRDACQRIDCGIPEWRMVQMDLVRETVYPSLRFELLRSFRLAQASIVRSMSR
jgi:hypothetical protein